MRAPLTSPTDFILAGNAVFTAESQKTGTRFTFRVRQPRPDTPHFVQLLNGPDNTSDYTYLGSIIACHQDAQGQVIRSYFHGKKSKVGRDAPSAIAARWIMERLLTRKETPGCTIYHEGRCGRCGRALTVPESILSGFGPECITKI